MLFPCRFPATLKANSHIPCRSLAVPLPWPCHYLPFSDSAERGQVAHIPSLDGRCKFTHTMPVPCRDCAVALSGRFQNDIFVAWQGNGMTCVNQTRPQCVNQMGNTQSKPLPERHGKGTAWYVWIRFKGVITLPHNQTVWSDRGLW
jgi:hypothetical protein